MCLSVCINRLQSSLVAMTACVYVLFMLLMSPKRAKQGLVESYVIFVHCKIQGFLLQLSSDN